MKRFVIFVVILLLGTQVVLLGGARAQDSYSPQIGQQIKQNCAVIQNILTNLRQRDISSRVAHVYVYEFLLQRTEAFSLRLGNNNLPHDKIDTDNHSITSELNKFKDDYDSYDNSLTHLMGINCQTSPQDFFNSLQTTRQQRGKLHSDITGLEKTWDRLLDDLASITLPGQKNAPTGGGGA